MHQKRVYISTLRKIRSGAVYSLFQANNMYQKLVRLDRKLAFIRVDSEGEGEGECDGDTTLATAATAATGAEE